MVVKKYISRTLNELDKKYNQALSSHSPDEATYFAKLAILEYCGWLEETMDRIVERGAIKKLTTVKFRQMLASIIRGNYGFQYKDHFRPMMCKIIGIVKMEKIEENLDGSGDLVILISELENIKTDRDDAAHTWISGTTRTYPAPSTTVRNLNRTYPILKNIYNQVARNN